MPRRNRAARDPERPLPGEASSDAPVWALVPGVEVRAVSTSKLYRCPGCDHEIRPRLPHVVVVPAEDASERRHWHTECWRQELRRLGHF